MQTKSNVPVSGDHRGWSAYWGKQCLNAIESAKVQTLLEINDECQAGIQVAIEHAVRSARLAFWHAARVKRYEYWKGEPK